MPVAKSGGGALPDEFGGGPASGGDEAYGAGLVAGDGTPIAAVRGGCCSDGSVFNGAASPIPPWAGAWDDAWDAACPDEPPDPAWALRASAEVLAERLTAAGDGLLGGFTGADCAGEAEDAATAGQHGASRGGIGSGGGIDAAGVAALDAAAADAAAVLAAFSPEDLAAAALRGGGLAAPAVSGSPSAAACLLAGIRVAQRLINHFQAVQQQWIAAFARPGVAVPLPELVDTCRHPAGRVPGSFRPPGELPGNLPVDGFGQRDLQSLLTHPRWVLPLADTAARLASAELGCALHLGPSSGPFIWRRSPPASAPNRRCRCWTRCPPHSPRCTPVRWTATGRASSPNEPSCYPPSSAAGWSRSWPPSPPPAPPPRFVTWQTGKSPRSTRKPRHAARWPPAKGGACSSTPTATTWPPSARCSPRPMRTWPSTYSTGSPPT